MFGFFKNSEVHRLEELQKVNSKRLSNIVNATSQSLHDMPRRGRKVIEDDVALILNNAEKFSSTVLASVCRLCPDILLRTDSRAPIQPENLRLVMKASVESMNDSVAGIEDQADVLVILNCLRYLAEATNAKLSSEDIQVLKNPRFLQQEAVVDSIKELKPVFDKASATNDTIWRDVAGILLRKDSAKALWCLKNALLLKQPLAQKRNDFRFLCREYIKSGDIDALKQLLESSNYGQEISDWGNSASLDPGTWQTLLVASYEAGGELSLSERAQLFAHYAQASSPETKADLFDGLDTVAVLKEKGLVTLPVLSACKDLLSRPAYLDVIFESYIDIPDSETRIPYFSMLENFVDGQPDLQCQLKRMCVSDNARMDENTFLLDAMRAGKHELLLKVFPVDLYRTDFLILARRLFSSGEGFKEASLLELILACHHAKRIESNNSDLDLDTKLLKLAKKYVIKTGQFVKCAQVGVSIDELLYAKRLQKLNGGSLADGEVAIPEKGILLEIFHNAGVALSPAERAALFLFKLQSDPSEFLETLYDLDTLLELQKQGALSASVLDACLEKGGQYPSTTIQAVYGEYLNHAGDDLRLANLKKLLLFCDQHNAHATLRKIHKRESSNKAQWIKDLILLGGSKRVLSVFPVSCEYDFLVSEASQLLTSQNDQERSAAVELLEACHNKKPLEDSDLVGELISGAFDSENLIALLTQKHAVKHFQHYFNNHSVSDASLVFLSASLLSLQHDDSLGALAQDSYTIELARFLANRAVYRLVGANTVPPELPSVTSKLCLLGECEDTLVQAFYPDWDPAKPLPAVIADVVNPQQNLSVPDVMGLVGNLDIDNSVRRNGYAAALLETRLLGHDGRHTSRVLSAGENISCVGCYDDLSEGDAVFQLDEKCEGTLCQECVGTSINNLKNNNECQWDCNCKIHSNTGIAFGANLDAILSARQATVMTHLATKKDWDKCEDSACIGGRPHVREVGGVVDTRSARRSVRQFSPAAAQQSVSEVEAKKENTECVLCHQVSVGKTEAEVKADIASVKMHLDYLGSVTSAGANGEGIIRECFECGKSVEKDDKCAAVTCPPEQGYDGAKGCGAKFDIVGGPKAGAGHVAHYFYHNDLFPAQEYIPGRQSVLWQAGFYSEDKHCRPSTRNPNLMKQLIKDKDRWFEAYKKKALADLEKQKDNKKEKPQVSTQLSSFKYPKLQQTSKNAFIKALVTGDFVSYQEKAAWHIGTVKNLSDKSECLTVIGRDGQPRDYSIDTPMIQPLGLVPIMPQTFLPREPIEYRNSTSQTGMMSYFESGGSDWRLGIVEKSNDAGVWIKVTEGKRSVFFPRDENRLAPAGTRHRL